MGLVDVVYPINCLGCGKRGKYVCSSCLQKVGFAENVCYVCKKPAIDGITHTKCKGKLGLDAVVAVWNYKGVIKRAIISLKYKYATSVTNELAEITAKIISDKYKLPSNTVLLPIPLHWYRKNWRGFNQTELLGKSLSEKLNWKYLPGILVRKRLTTPQVSLKGKERKQNVRGIFSFNDKYKGLVNYVTTIILFDDVYTTGSTMKEAGKVLKRKGFERVWGVAIAK